LSIAGNQFPALNGCIGKSIPIKITVNPSPTPVLSDGAICIDATSGNTLQSYLLNSGLSSSNYNFEWFLNDVKIDGEIKNSYEATEIGKYAVIATNKNTGCVSDEAVANVISKNPATSFSTIVSDPFTEFATIRVLVEVGTGPFEYKLDDEPFQRSSIFADVSSGLHHITVRDTEGCTNITQPVTVIGYPKFFTPNGDGNNDTWNIEGLNDQANAQIFIYDRYGKLIKQISTTGQGWDGTFNGHELPSTDYWFTVAFKENNINKEFKAHFSLKR
jgi:gliding motility-associated-like protein